MEWRKQLTEPLIYRVASRYLCVCVCLSNGIVSMPKVSPMNKVVRYRADYVN